MRKGQNPAKFAKTVAKPERITVAVLNYIPFLSGFYSEALDVLKVSLETMHNDPGLPFDLMIFDNGSCPEVRDWLIGEKEAGRIQYLVLSEKNMGKGGAWNIILAGAPGEIIAYADSDILYYPGWLAWVDGKIVPLYRANVAGRAAPVPAGRHRVEFTYEPQSLQQGIALSAISLALLLGGLLAVMPRAKTK